MSSVSNGGRHTRALPRAALGAMHPAGGDADRVGRSVARQRPAQSRAMGDAADQDGVDVEPEAERKHAGDGSAAAGA